MKLSEVGAPTF